MGNFGFLMGIGAAQKAQKAAAKSTDGKSTDRRHHAIEIVVGILLALFIAAGLLFLMVTVYHVWVRAGVRAENPVTLLFYPATHILWVVSAGGAAGDVMKQITVIGASLAIVTGVITADAQGIGYAPGVNPSNPQDLTYRSNPQDLLVPGGNNPQDLVRRPPSGNVPLLGRSEVTSVPTSQSLSPALQYTVNTKPKKKPRHQGSAPRRWCASFPRYMQHFVAWRNDPSIRNASTHENGTSIPSRLTEN
jgi:hypothetical protein